MAARIQRSYRAYVRRKIESAILIQRAYREWRTVREFIQLRDYGHQVYLWQKQRRRFSLLSIRRFLGDYLDAKNALDLRILCRYDPVSSS
jgi:myosin-1